MYDMDYSRTSNELMCKFKEELGKGFEQLNAEDASKLSDMIKDLSEAEKNMCEAMYYREVISAMQEKQGMYDQEWDDRMGYRGGNQMSRNSRQGYHMQDVPYLERYLDGPMGYRQSGSGNSRMGYEGELMDKYESYRMAKQQGNQMMADMYAKQYVSDIKSNIKDILMNCNPEMKKDILKMMEEMKA